MKGLWVCLGLLAGALPAAAAPRVLDAFESTAGWTALPASGVEMRLSSDARVRGRSLRIDFDFQKGGGYAVAQKKLDFALPANYRITFRVRGETRPQNLELKLIDSSGANVWWVNVRDFAFTPDWKTVAYKKRHVSFAWGPLGGGELRHAAALEFAVTAGSGGKGTVWLDELAIEALPVPPTTPLAIVSQRASSGVFSSAILRLPGEHGDTTNVQVGGVHWQPAGRDRTPWAVFDLGSVREFGGMVVDWAPRRYATDYVIEIEDAAGRWRAVRTITGSDGGKDPIDLPESEARRVRLRVVKPAGSAALDATISFKPLTWSATPAAFLEAVAKDAPRGRYPRGMIGEQVYWTVLGVDGAREEALLSEDGMLETGKAQFSIEPFLWIAGGAGGRLVTWSDVRAVPHLEQGDLPIPKVRWEGAPLELTVTAMGVGTPARSGAWARYRVRNPGPTTVRGTLFLALRPFQVNPPAQFLNQPGGVAPLRTLRRDGRAVFANDTRGVLSLTAPDGFGATGFDQGEISDWLAEGRLPVSDSVRDEQARASGTLSYALDLAPGAQRDVVIVVPFTHPPEPNASQIDDATASREFDARHAEVVKEWREKLDRVTISLPDSEIVQTLKAQIGWILVNRDGAGIQPGSRSYERSWIRDGALTSAALLRLGHPEPVRDFLKWFADFQYADGKVPCCVDHRGSDPVPEHDSHGEFVYLAAEYFRMTGDLATVREVWPNVRAAVAYLDTLRAQRRTDEWRAPGKEHFFGILPPSISHEGYSAKPMHSYWDDLWALRGYKDAVFLAERLGHREDLPWLMASRDEFARDFGASVRAAMKVHQIDYIPGCADLGDFDATSTTIALDPVQAGDVLPREALERTFERYGEFVAGRANGNRWDAFTPYEWRTVGAMWRLGERQRAAGTRDWLMQFRRPAGFRHWAEVVDSLERRQRFIGDMPHTWCGSDFVRSTLDLLAFERESDSALVITAGENVIVRNLRTRWGPISYSMERERPEEPHRSGSAPGLRLRIEQGSFRVPPGGIVARKPVGPGGLPVRSCTDERGTAIPCADGAVIVRRLPAEIRWGF